MAGLNPMFTLREVVRTIDKFVDERERDVVMGLSRIGIEATNKARQIGNYRDQTGNLRSSTGFMVTRSRTIEQKMVSTANKDKGGRGKAAARGMFNTLKSQAGDGMLELWGVAGMEYAAAVESKKNYNVLTGSVPDPDDVLRRLKDWTGSE
jgi:hypothetical protein